MINKSTAINVMDTMHRCVAPKITTYRIFKRSLISWFFISAAKLDLYESMPTSVDNKYSQIDSIEYFSRFSKMNYLSAYFRFSHFCIFICTWNLSFKFPLSWQELVPTQIKNYEIICVKHRTHNSEWFHIRRFFTVNFCQKWS